MTDERHDARIVELRIFDELGDELVPSAMCTKVGRKQFCLLEVSDGAAVCNWGEMTIPSRGMKHVFTVTKALELANDDVFGLPAQQSQRGLRQRNCSRKSLIFCVLESNLLCAKINVIPLYVDPFAGARAGFAHGKA